MSGTVFASGYAPNRLTCLNQTVTTDVQIIAMDGTGYADLATLLAAGKTPFPFGNASTPGLDPGMFTQFLTVQNMTQAKAFSVVWNWPNATPPTTDQMELIPDSVDRIIFKGPVGNVWVAKSVNSDNLQIAVGY